jgi:hypothetical protein
MHAARVANRATHAARVTHARKQARTAGRAAPHTLSMTPAYTRSYTRGTAQNTVGLSSAQSCSSVRVLPGGVFGGSRWACAAQAAGSGGASARRARGSKRHGAGTHTHTPDTLAPLPHNTHPRSSRLTRPASAAPPPPPCSTWQDQWRARGWHQRTLGLASEACVHSHTAAPCHTPTWLPSPQTPAPAVRPHTPSCARAAPVKDVCQRQEGEQHVLAAEPHAVVVQELADRLHARHHAAVRVHDALGVPWRAARRGGGGVCVYVCVCVWRCAVTTDRRGRRRASRCLRHCSSMPRGTRRLPRHAAMPLKPRHAIPPPPPVVPLVYMMVEMSSGLGGTASCGCAAPSSSSCCQLNTAGTPAASSACQPRRVVCGVWRVVCVVGQQAARWTWTPPIWAGFGARCVLNAAVRTQHPPPPRLHDPGTRHAPARLRPRPPPSTPRRAAAPRATRRWRPGRPWPAPAAWRLVRPQT